MIYDIQKIKELIKEYLREKQNLITKHFPHYTKEFITNDDINDIDNMTYEQIKKISNNLGRKLNDTFLCPHCIIYLDNDCISCTFGKRHDYCLDSNSDYSKLVNLYKENNTSITEVIGKKLIKLIRKY